MKKFNLFDRLKKFVPSTYKESEKPHGIWKKNSMRQTSSLTYNPRFFDVPKYMTF